MTYVLSARERKLMDHLQLEHEIFQIRGQLPVGTGMTTLDRLTSMGLLETGAGRFGSTGWRLTDDGWRCMYGKTESEIRAAGVAIYPLKVWSWPPSPNANRLPPKRLSRLASLPPRLAELPPKLRKPD